MILIFLFHIFLVHVTSQPEDLHIHVIPHSHIDHGWTMTVQGYREHTIKVINNIVTSLKVNNERIFNWAETEYFRSWYEQASKEDRDFMHELVESSRWNFQNGGIVANDEASTSYRGIIDQISQGQEWLFNTFGVVPKTCWHIDPFGHDIRMVEILRKMGFSAMFINRVHFNIKKSMRKEKSIEFLWKIGPYEIFTNDLYMIRWGYSFPPTCFDFETCPQVSTSNIKDLAKKLLDYAREMRSHYLTKHVFITFGGDFRYLGAEKQFSNIEKLIDYIEKNYNGVKMTFTPIDEYYELASKEILNTEAELKVLKHDFFPYMEDGESWWTGYFTTTPSLKRIIRSNEEKLFALQPLLAYKSTDKMWDNYKKMRTEISTAQHHDYITGTSSQKVVSDYWERMKNAQNIGENLFSESIKLILDKDIKEIKDEILEKGKREIILYNPSNKRNAYMRFLTSGCVDIEMVENGEYEYEVFKVNTNYEVYIKIGVDSMSIKNFILNVRDCYDENIINIQDCKTKMCSVENDFYKINVNDGYLEEIEDKINNMNHKWIKEKQYMDHQSKMGGIYVQCPQDGAQLSGNSHISTKIFEGEMVQKIIVNNKRFDYEITLFNGFEWIDYQFNIKPIPTGKEMVMYLPVGSEDDEIKLITYDGQHFTPRDMDIYVSNKCRKGGQYYPSVFGGIAHSKKNNVFVSVLINSALGMSVERNYLQIHSHRRVTTSDKKGPTNNDGKGFQGRFLIKYWEGKNGGIESSKLYDIQKESVLLNAPVYKFTSNYISDEVINIQFAKIDESIELMGMLRDEHGNIIIKLRNLDILNGYVLDINSLLLSHELLEVKDVLLNGIGDIESYEELPFENGRTISYDFSKINPTVFNKNEIDKDPRYPLIINELKENEWDFHEKIRNNMLHFGPGEMKALKIKMNFFSEKVEKQKANNGKIENSNANEEVIFSYNEKEKNNNFENEDIYIEDDNLESEYYQKSFDKWLEDSSNSEEKNIYTAFYDSQAEKSNENGFLTLKINQVFNLINLLIIIYLMYWFFWNRRSKKQKKKTKRESPV